MGLALFGALAATTASAQVDVITKPQESVFATGMTFPQGGIILAGSSTNPATAQPYRYLWTASDQAGHGLCRVDPDLGAPAPHRINSATCITSIPTSGIEFLPGQFAFDPLLNNIYAVDLSASTQGIFRLHFIPSGDRGHGAVDPNHMEVLGGNGIGRNGLAGCGLAGDGLSSLSLGPDGNLYVGFAHSGDIVRVQAPQTEPLPCSNVQVIGSTPDNLTEKGFGWIGHDLYGADGQSAWVISNADQCLTAANGNSPCTATPFLASQTQTPSMVTTDQVYPATDGIIVFIGNPRDITEINTQNLQVTPAFESGFQLLKVIVPDPTAHALYVADDASAGSQQGQGKWWQVLKAAVPGVPLNVLAIAGTGSINLQWNAAPGLVPTSYIVRTSFNSLGLTMPDVIVAPVPGTAVPPTQTTIDRLVNGGVYQFEVAATNAAGTSFWSRLTNLVSPKIPTVPQPPSHVSAAAKDSSAIVAWSGTPVYQNGGFPVTIYKLEVEQENQPLETIDVPSTPTSSTLVASSFTYTVTGLTNGMHYKFMLRATNQMGDSAPSVPSNVVVPNSQPAAQLPGDPRNVQAVAGDASATVNWTAPVSDGGSSITRYVVVTFIGNVPTSNVVSVNAPATSTTLSGLTNGTTYNFVVHAVNVIGAGASSSPSNSVMPVGAPHGLVPGVPTNITVTPGSTSAFIAWTAPATDGGKPITSYSVVALQNGLPVGITATAPASATGTAVNGLSSGVTYTFVVHAFNAVGDSGPSLPSAPVTLAVPPAAAANLTISLSGPSTVTPGTNASFSLAVNNIGTAAAQHVTVTHAFSANGATFVSMTASLGSCSASGNTMTCNLGTMPAAATATISITLKVTAPVLNRSFVLATDANGNAIPSVSPAKFLAKLKTSTSPAPAGVIVQNSSDSASASTPPASTTFTPLGSAADGSTGNASVISGDGSGTIFADRATAIVPWSAENVRDTVLVSPAVHSAIRQSRICTGP
jgi:titin